MSIRTTRLKWEGKETHPARQIPQRPGPCLAGPLIYDQWGGEPDTPNTLWGKHGGFMNLEFQQGNERDKKSLTVCATRDPNLISPFPVIHCCISSHPKVNGVKQQRSIRFTGSAGQDSDKAHGRSLISVPQYLELQLKRQMASGDLNSWNHLEAS